jgi:hypothetical protein
MINRENCGQFFSCRSNARLRRYLVTNADWAPEIELCNT